MGLRECASECREVLRECASEGCRGISFSEGGRSISRGGRGVSFRECAR